MPQKDNNRGYDPLYMPQKTIIEDIILKICHKWTIIEDNKKVNSKLVRSP